MNTSTREKIQQIDRSLAWFKQYRPDHYNQRFLQLVECRKVLKRIADAEENNPGIAAFGKSQVGKSYLISCLLQNHGEDFMVRAGDKSYNFVFAINPPSAEGGGVESTGVVSRFSSFKRNPGAYNPDLPVLVKTFSVSDIVTILADSYFNNFNNYTSLSESEIQALCNKLQEKFSSREEQSAPVISPDEILRMKDYFAKHINHAQTFNNSPFFNQLALLMSRIPVSEYAELFSHLWNKDSNMTRLFEVLLGTLSRFDYARYIYLPIEAVLHAGVKEDTIMSVQCLTTLLDDNAKYTTDAYVKRGDNYEKKAVQVPKSAICAICSEVVFKIDEEFLSSTGRYDLSGIGEDVLPRINQGPIEMSMLRDNDLLDFPGARSTEQENAEKISQKTVLLNCFLRGKVAYLFNKYNEDMGINVLLYCHHNKDNDVTGLYKLLEDWVNNYVGETPEERRHRMEFTKISPLFFIGTMFNLDMQLGIGAESTEQAIDQRWITRFNTVMNKQCFHRDTVEWVRNWTHPGEDFQNSYMLRDYKFSGPKSGLYSGFAESKKETGMIMTEDYYQRMRKTFIENSFVRQYFADPALSWDVAASINNDGALYIMEQLSEVASRMDKAREAQFSEINEKVMARVYQIMQEYLVSEDTDVILQQNIRKANGIFREMEFSCQNHPEYFGHLIQALQLTESACFKALHKLIPSLSAKVHGADTIRDYELIHKRCDDFRGCADDASKMRRLMAAYHFETQEDAIAFLKSKKIDKDKLFRGEGIKRKNSAVIAHELMELWRSNITGVRFMDMFSGSGSMDAIALTDLVTCILDTADILKLQETIEAQIADYVDVLNISGINESLIADIISTTISDFIIDFGARYLNKKQIDNACKVAKSDDLPCMEWVGKERKEHFEDEELTGLFNDILSAAGQFTPAYVANYNSWLAFMYVAFLAHIQVPDFNRAANDKLKELLTVLKH